MYNNVYKEVSRQFLSELEPPIAQVNLSAGWLEVYYDDEKNDGSCIVILDGRGPLRALPVLLIEGASYVTALLYCITYVTEPVDLVKLMAAKAEAQNPT